LFSVIQLGSLELIAVPGLSLLRFLGKAWLLDSEASGLIGGSPAIEL